MSIESNVRLAKDFFAAIGSGDKQRVLALVAEEIEWIVPGEAWPLGVTHRGHAGLADVLQKASKEVEMTYLTPPEFVAQGNRVLVVSVAMEKIKATNKPFQDAWVFDIKVRDEGDEDPGVYRRAGTGAGFREGRELQALTIALFLSAI